MASKIADLINSRFEVNLKNNKENFGYYEVNHTFKDAN